MKLPFVSRGRFEDAQRLISVLEEERRVLIDRIQLMAGQRPLFEKTAPASLNAPSKEGEKEEAEPMRSRLTIAQVRSKANMAAAANAQKNSPNMKVGA
jgi:hypothetical protein